MTQIASKFSAHLPLLEEAVVGDADLRSNQKVYRKVFNYLKKYGVSFTGDADEDYEIVLDYIYSEGIAAE
tara:strand:- start:644 stop:853 length:210 start_codon:yes stop_codon:yes gene_type:complete